MADDDLLAHLLALGATEEQVDALEDGQLIGLAGDLQVAKGLDLSLEELAAAAGCTIEAARTIYEHAGLRVDDLAGFGLGDVAVVSLVTGDSSGLIEQLGPSILRVAGSGLARLAEAMVATYVQDIEPQTVSSTDLVALADLNAFGSNLALAVGDNLSALFRHHMWAAVRRQRAAQDGVIAPEIVKLAVAFVDLVGFTSLSQGSSPAALLATVESFERRAFDTAQQFGSRIVKSIGDEVMIAGPDASTVAATALALIEKRGDDGSVASRGGVCAGDVLFRLGDYYGPVVNLASRLTDQAAPDELLTDERTATASGITAFGAGNRTLKGFPDPVDVWSVTGATTT